LISHPHLKINFFRGSNYYSTGRDRIGYLRAHIDFARHDIGSQSVVIFQKVDDGWSLLFKDGGFTCFQDSRTDMNSVYSFWEGTLMPQQELKFCKVKAVSLNGVGGLQQLIDKGVAYILIHNLCNTVDPPDEWPGDGVLPPPGGGPGGGIGKHNEDNYKPGDGDPTGTIWHELYPVYCQYWEVIDWIDNGDGILSYCDTLVSATETDTIKEHVKLVTTTMTVEEIPPVESMYLDYLNYNPMNDDLSIPDVLGTYWHEAHPEYCIMYETVDVIDNGNGYLDSCDIIILHTISGPD
jgi:hypothetical protein